MAEARSDRIMAETFLLTPLTRTKVPPPIRGHDLGDRYQSHGVDQHPRRGTVGIPIPYHFYRYLMARVALAVE